MKLKKVQTSVAWQQWGILRNVRKRGAVIYSDAQCAPLVVRHDEVHYFSPSKICASSCGKTGRANVFQIDWVQKV